MVQNAAKGKKDVRTGVSMQGRVYSNTELRIVNLVPKQRIGPANEVAGLSVTVTNWFI